jgi:methylated-DNA-[protein]-cysteine S-methyltransferase
MTNSLLIPTQPTQTKTQSYFEVPKDIQERLKRQSLGLPFQGLRLHWHPEGLTQIDFVWQKDALPEPSPLNKSQADCHDLLNRYFAGEPVSFEAMPLVLLKGTTFQKKAWQGLQAIPYGETRSYQWLAEWAGSPKASRAIGQANRANPIPIIIPCHRVLPKGESLATGKLGGYMGGSERGIQIKSALLKLESFK